MAVDTQPEIYMVHQPGKVGSQTIEAALRASGVYRIERHHYLSDTGIGWLEAALIAGTVGNADVAAQLRTAREARTNLDRTDRVWVLCGFRDPLRLCVAAYFQNLPLYCPWLTYRESAIPREVETLIVSFNTHFDRVICGDVRTDYTDAVLKLKLQGPEPWFNKEFNPFYQMDIYDHPVGSDSVVRFEKGRFRFVLYRTETLQFCLREIIRRVGLRPPSILKSENVGAEKVYGRLYAAFKKRFRPTSAMIDYYYGGRYFQHFYNGTVARRRDC